MVNREIWKLEPGLAPLALATLILLTGQVLCHAGEGITLAEAIGAGLSRNHDLKIQELEVKIAATAIPEAASVFDPVFSATVQNSDRIGRQVLQNGSLGDNVANRTDSNFSVARTYPSGTEVETGVTINRNRSARAPNLFSTRLGLAVNHPLRQGAGRRVNLVRVEKARLDVKISEFELQGFVLSFVAEIERQYWSLFLAEKELAIRRESLGLARVQLEETGKKIDLGRIPESELAAAEAEVALREEGVIDAESALEKERISFLRLINAESDRFWESPVSLADEPLLREQLAPDPGPYLDSALKSRPELRQSELNLEKGALDLITTRDGLLPRLDFFLTLGRSGYSTVVFSERTANFGAKQYDLAGGVEWELPLHRRAARAAHDESRYSHQQQREALKNLRQLIQEDVLSAFLEARRAHQQILATGRTVEKQKEKLRVEEIKFQVGKTTSFQVAQAQRDLAASQIAALKARVGAINALSNLHRFDGSLCRLRGIQVEN